MGVGCVDIAERVANAILRRRRARFAAFLERGLAIVARVKEYSGVEIQGQKS